MGGSLVKELNRERAKAKCFCAYLKFSLILDLTLVRGGVFFQNEWVMVGGARCKIWFHH
jgi:hypothetical protein